MAANKMLKRAPNQLICKSLKLDGIEHSFTFPCGKQKLDIVFGCFFCCSWEKCE